MKSHSWRALVLLVVDDNVDAADSLAMLLEADGDVVARAYGGRAAVHLVEQMSPDVVISDIEMPGMSGLDEAIAIRGLPLTRQPWMVAVTGATRHGIEGAVFEAGYDFFMAKPTNFPKLIGVIDEIRHRPAR